MCNFTGKLWYVCFLENCKKGMRASWKNANIRASTTLVNSCLGALWFPIYAAFQRRNPEIRGVTHLPEHPTTQLTQFWGFWKKYHENFPRFIQPTPSPARAAFFGAQSLRQLRLPPKRKPAEIHGRIAGNGNLRIQPWIRGQFPRFHCPKGLCSKSDWISFACHQKVTKKNIFQPMPLVDLTFEMVFRRICFRSQLWSFRSITLKYPVLL